MRTILHSDMNSCYASIELLHRPELRGTPMAVGGDPEQRHGIVLAKDELAKKAGVKTGMALWQARQVCPGIVFVPPRMELYLRFSRLAHQIYADYTDQQEAFGIDESWLDVTGSCGLFGTGQSIAQEIRSRFKRELGITVSIGVSWNKIYAKLGSDYKKPDAVTEFSRENYKQLVYPLPASDLLYVGRSTAAKLQKHSIRTIGDLAEADPNRLKVYLGKMGLVLSAFARGEDRTPVNNERAEAPIKSIGNSLTAPRDLLNDEDVSILILMMAESVAARLRENHFLCRCVGLYVRDRDLIYYSAQSTLDMPTDLTDTITRTAMQLFRKTYSWRIPVRSIGVRASDLCSADMPFQIDLFNDLERMDKLRARDKAIDGIRRRFGFHSIQRGLSVLDSSLGRVNAKDEHTVHPHSYMEFGNRTGVDEYL